jgi:phosphatidylglycerophosphate synthase
MRRSKHGAAGAIFTFTSSRPTLDGAVTTTCTPASGSTFPIGATTVTCSATDAHGNHSAASFTVTVTDTTGPAVTVPANATVEATSAAGAIYSYTASATDILDGSVAATCVPPSGSTFTFGATTVACTAADAHGNHSSASFTVTVIDTTGPAITVPNNATVEATSATGASYIYTVSATDVLDGTVAVTCTPGSGATIPFGPSTISCTATDAHGNHSSVSFTVHVTDTTGPVVTVPANATVEATTATGAAYSFTASATDILDGAVATALHARERGDLRRGCDDGDARRATRRQFTPARSP